MLVKRTGARLLVILYGGGGGGGLLMVFICTIVAKLETSASLVWGDLNSQFQGLGNPKPGIPSDTAG